MNDTSGHFLTLLRELQEGSQEAARELAETYRDHVLRCIRRSLHWKMRSLYDSLDLAQLVWASVLIEPDKLGEISSPEQFVKFLAGVARHKVAHVGRKMQTQKNNIGRQERIDEDCQVAGPHPVSRDPTPSAAAIYQERYDQLVDRPRERDRQIVELRSEGNTYDEIAEKLDIDARTARTIITRLKRMQQIKTQPATAPPQASASARRRDPHGE